MLSSGSMYCTSKSCSSSIILNIFIAFENFFLTTAGFGGIITSVMNDQHSFNQLNQLQSMLSEQEKINEAYDLEISRLREERTRVGERLKEQQRAAVQRAKRRNFEQY